MLLTRGYRVFKEPTLRDILVQELPLPPPSEDSHPLWAWVRDGGFQRGD